MRERVNRIVIIDAGQDSIKIANFLHRDKENKVMAFLIIGNLLQVQKLMEYQFLVQTI